jgi:transcriptional regulator with XRE-family HTH domain
MDVESPPASGAPYDFSVGALYAALDAQRQARGLSWQQVAREINALSGRVPARPISPSTLTGMRNRAVIEGDGVLQMLRWLQRTPESFIPGGEEAAAEPARLPDVGSFQILRFDTRKLYTALDAQRSERGMTWTQLANEIGGLTAASLTRLSKGGRTGFPQVMRIARWLGRPVADFTRAADR